MHYHISDRRDSPYWQEIAEMKIPDTLRHRIELFRETGEVYHVPGELFGVNSWVQVMLGQGIAPRRYHPTADVMTREDLTRFLGDVRDNVLHTVRQMPQHMDYMRSYAPAPVPEAVLQAV